MLVFESSSYSRPVWRMFCDVSESREKSVRAMDNRKEAKRRYYLRNKDKARISNREYYVRNKDNIVEWKRRNKDDIKDWKHRYYVRKRDSIGLSVRDYYLQNKNAIKDTQREYYLRNKDDIGDAMRDYYTRIKGNNLEWKRDYYSRNKLSLAEWKEGCKDELKQYQRDYYVRKLDNPELYSPSDTLSKQSWKSPESVREYLDSIGKQLNISDYHDWYRISHSQVADLGGQSLYTKFGNLGGALQYAYPEIQWDHSKFSLRGKKSGQRWLKIKIEELLPGVEIIEDFQHAELRWENVDRQVELDLWIPRYQIGIEFQGEHHYYSLENAFGSKGVSNLYLERDIMKQSLCQIHGITLITIPYWWDGERESLSATLFKARPDVFPVSTFDPIPAEMPLKYLVKEFERE